MLSASPTSELAYQASRAQCKAEDAHCIVSALEATSSLTLPWLANSPQRQEAIQLRNERKYHRLLDDLEHRAISRRFELEKMGLPKTGEYLIIVFRYYINFSVHRLQNPSTYITVDWKTEQDASFHP
jgi:hypothetical protein